MNIKKGIIIMSILLCSICLFGCDEETEVIDGGNTTYVDDDAPKVIESKDITGFHASFYVAKRSHGDDDHFFEFEIKDNNNELYAYENNTGISYKADETLLKNLQQVIDDNNLVELYNGLYDVTAGLAPECSARSFTVDYASGEKLYFTRDNDPYAKYVEDIYDVFAEWFASKGIEDLYPDTDKSQVKRINIVYVHDGVYVYYGELLVDGKNKINRQVVNNNEFNQMDDDRVIDVPDGYYEKITELVEQSEIDRLYLSNRFDTEIDRTADTYIDLYIEYEDEHRINIETSDEEELKLIVSKLDEIMKYMDSWFME